MLISDNPQYKPIKIKDLEEIEILGRVIGSYDIRVKNF
ncbi:S24 family peptidase [Campylobacter sputorum]|nr:MULTISPECIES: S24 family peptidase [Campylobacter]